MAEVTGRKSLPVVSKAIPNRSQNNHGLFMSPDRFGGFPEPVLKQNTRVLRWWHSEKVDRLFREDIQDIEPIRDIVNRQLLGDMLPDRAGSLLSLNSLREDLEVSHRAVSNWMNILESFCYCFRIYPDAAKNFPSLKKEPKLYIWSSRSNMPKKPDWKRCQNDRAGSLRRIFSLAFQYSRSLSSASMRTRTPRSAAFFSNYTDRSFNSAASAAFVVHGPENDRFGRQPAIGSICAASAQYVSG